MRFGPLAFLFVVTGGWAAIRFAMLWPEESSSDRKRGVVPWRPAVAQADAVPVPDALSRRSPPARAIRRASRPAATATPVHEAVLAAAPDMPVMPAPIASSEPAPDASPIQSPRPLVRPFSPPRRFSISGWTILRGAGRNSGLAAAGQLGGSQAGVRARQDLGAGLALAARVSGPLRQELGKEVALALDWRPAATLPVTFTLERRAGLDRGGRDAFAAGVSGGFDTVGLPHGLIADGYAQAGVVGLKRRDLYVDGALRVERALAVAGRVRIGAGAGLWGGAQPGASRLDTGPQIVAHVSIGRAALRAGAEWRVRLAGRAQPGSGPALSIGTDF